MIIFNLFDKIEEILNTYELTFQNYKDSKFTFEKEIFDEWEFIIDIPDINKDFNQDKRTTNNFLINVEKIEKNNNGSIPKNIPHKEINILNEKEKILKKLYKKIAIKTHPDKVKDNNKVALFKKAKSFYDNNILIGLIFISKKINIKIELQKFHKSIIIELIKEIAIVQEKINNMKSSIYLKWKDDLNNKNKYKEQYAKENNLRKKNKNL